MKLMIVTMLFAATAFADVKVGTMAKFDAQSVTKDGAISKATVTYEVLEYNAAKKEFKHKVTVEEAGQAPQMEESWVPEANFLTDAKVTDILTNCVAKYKGVAGKVKVPAGEYDSCALKFADETEEGNVWVAKTSFGIVKQEATEKATGTKSTSALIIAK